MLNYQRVSIRSRNLTWKNRKKSVTMILGSVTVTKKMWFQQAQSGPISGWPKRVVPDFFGGPDFRACGRLQRIGWLYHSHGISMVHWHRWFNYFHSMVIFHCKLLNSQRVFVCSYHSHLLISAKPIFPQKVGCEALQLATRKTRVAQIRSLS